MEEIVFEGIRVPSCEAGSLIILPFLLPCDTTPRVLHCKNGVGPIII